MLMDAPDAPPRAVTLSVSGLKTMFEMTDVPALLETQTPPPVVPTKSRLPVASDGSSASEETRPETRPKLDVTTAVGPRDCQVAVAGDAAPEAASADAMRGANRTRERSALARGGIRWPGATPRS